MDARAAVARLTATYPAILHARNRKAHGLRRIATLTAIFENAGLTRDQAVAHLARDLEGCDPLVIGHITKHVLTFWSKP